MLPKNKLIKYWGREYNFYFMASFIMAMNVAMRHFLRMAFKDHLGEGIGRATSGWGSEYDLNKFQKKISKFLKSLEEFNKYNYLYKKLSDNLRKVGGKIQRADLKKVSNAVLNGLMRDFDKADRDFMVIGQWTAFNLSEMAPCVLEQRLVKEKLKFIR